jgi:DOPA 4,5-dioxygenase
MEQTPATGGTAMSNAPDSITNCGYHAHIYYDPARTRPTAKQLCAVLSQQCPVQVGGFRDEPVGPHPVANVQIY